MSDPDPDEDDDVEADERAAEDQPDKPLTAAEVSALIPKEIG